MDGYRQDSFDPNAGEPEVQQPKGRWTWFFGTIAYMIPLFFLWSKTGFPESFGVAECHGKGCWIDDWYHSYLLVEQHSLLDIVTFLYMWAPIVALVGYFVLPKLRGTKFSLYDDQPPPGVPDRTVGTSSVFDAEEAAERRRKILIVLASSLVFGTLLIAIYFYKGGMS